MSEVKVTKNFFLYNGVKYFRGKAEDVEIGSYGPKEDPLGAKASLSVQNRVARENLKGRVRYVTTASFDWSTQSKAEVEVEGRLNYFTLGATGVASFSYEKAKSVRLKLMKLVIDEGDLRAMLNNDADGARRFLAREGNDGRIVSTVWVVLEGELAESYSTAFSSGGTVSANLTKTAELEISADHAGGASGQSKIILAKHTTFAYVMHKVQKWNKDKSRIEDLELDEKGLN